MGVLTWMGDHPILTFFLALIFADVVVKCWKAMWSLGCVCEDKDASDGS